MVGNFIVKNNEVKSKQVTDFIQTLNLFENEIFGDAYYDIIHRMSPQKNLQTFPVMTTSI